MPESFKDLPPGFVIQQQPQARPAGAKDLPPGFVIQQQPAAEPGFFERHRGTITQALAGPTLAIARDPLGYSRDLAAEAVPFATTAGGIALGAPGGLPGMAAGGALGASMGARARQLIRGEPEPTTAEKAIETGLGAASGVFGALLSRAFAARPDVRLSLDMQTKAKQIDQAFRAQEKAAGKAIKGVGFKSPVAKDLWARSKVAEQIERALRVSRGDPDMLRRQFERLADNRMLRRLPPELHALVLDVTRQSTPAGWLRAVGEIKRALEGGTLLTQGTSVGTLGATGAAGRALDRAATNRAVTQALEGIAGMPVPRAAPNIGAGAVGGAATARPLRAVPDYLAGEVFARRRRPDPEREALARELLKGRR